MVLASTYIRGKYITTEMKIEEQIEADRQQDTSKKIIQFSNVFFNLMVKWNYLHYLTSSGTEVIVCPSVEVSA